MSYDEWLDIDKKPIGEIRQEIRRVCEEMCRDYESKYIVKTQGAFTWLEKKEKQNDK